MAAEFEITCSICGSPLVASLEAYRRGPGAMLLVEPCESCREKVRDEARSQGYDEGIEDGRRHPMGY